MQTCERAPLCTGDTVYVGIHVYVHSYVHIFLKRNNMISISPLGHSGDFTEEVKSCYKSKDTLYLIKQFITHLSRPTISFIDS